MTIATMKQALDAQEYLLKDLRNRDSIHLMGQGALDRLKESNDALRAAIEQAEKVEPVAWVQDIEEEMLPEFAFSWVKTQLHDCPLFTHPAPVPAGWQLVPGEPTKAMLSAGWGNDHLYADLYKAMLAAAPRSDIQS